MVRMFTNSRLGTAPRLAPGMAWQAVPARLLAMHKPLEPANFLSLTKPRLLQCIYYFWLKPFGILRRPILDCTVFQGWCDLMRTS